MSSAENQAAVFLETQSEKPSHYQYLKEFRVEQCPNFIQHKCTSHKPYTCFRWHFQNQRRRRPVRRRDGTFNYSPDVYCTKYDETTGICEDGDDCPYLHRTSGDTERRYHLRYYKTGICVYDTDSRGFCVKNGQHCAFAHGVHDLRSPVYDIRELQAMDGYNGGSENGIVGNGDGLNNLDKERNALNEDPRWTDLAYVLACYKTELCKRPPRLCRQGYACPQYHNAKDKRRPPKKLKYRSTPCPNVKAGDEWGDPANCEAGDTCAYCHTRTEQQFHPEIYKSTKCNDVLQTSYCPRGPFCAFAHGDKEMQSRHELMNDDVELKHYNQPMNNGNNGSSHGHNNGQHTVSSATTISGRCHSKSVSIASSLPDHYPIHGINNLPNPSSNGKNHVTDSSFNSASAQSGGIGSGDRGFSYQLGPIGSRPRSYSTSQANRATASHALDIFEHVLGRSVGHNSHSEQNNLMNGDMRPSSIRRSSGIYEQPASSLFARGYAPASSDMSQAGARSRSTLTDNYNTADTVGSVVESAIGEIDLPLGEIEAPFERLSCGNVSSLMNGNCADTLIEHHHPSQQNSSPFVTSNTTGNNSVAIIGSLNEPAAGMTMAGSAPVNIPGSRLNSDRSLNLSNASPPISSSPLTSSLGHSLGSFSLSPFCQQLATPSQMQNSMNNAASGSSLQSDPGQLFKKMFLPRFNLFLIFTRNLHYPESLSEVGANMILQETFCKYESKWKEVLREVNWNQKETACWINSNFPVMKDFAMGVFARYSREIMVQDRSEKEVVDDDFMNLLLTMCSRSVAAAGINTSSKHMM